RAPATTVASSSRTVSTRPSNSSRVADRATVTPNNPQRSDSTSARLRATTAQTSSSGVLNPNRRTETGAAVGQPATPHMGQGTSTTRTSRARRGNSVGRSNAQRLASMTTPSMFENDFYRAGIYGMPYGYGNEDGFEDLYYDDYDDPYEYGYYGG